MTNFSLLSLFNKRIFFHSIFLHFDFFSFQFICPGLSVTFSSLSHRKLHKRRKIFHSSIWKGKEEFFQKEKSSEKGREKLSFSCSEKAKTHLLFRWMQIVINELSLLDLKLNVDWMCWRELTFESYCENGVHLKLCQFNYF
jgi:hypothetical protein